MNLPNKLTIFRILLVPVMVIIPYLNISGTFLNISIEYWIMGLIFVIASYTDHLDGKLARKNNQITAFGKFADPLADKILVLAAMLIFVEAKSLPAWIPIIVLFREFGAFIRENLTGAELIINILATVFMLISVIATIFSGWDYVKNGKELLKD